MRRSKTSLLKLPFGWWQEELKRLPMMLCIQLYYYWTFITWSFTFTPMAAVQLCWERELSDHSMFLNWYIFAISTCKQRNILQSLAFLVRGSPYARLSQFPSELAIQRLCCVLWSDEAEMETRWSAKLKPCSPECQIVLLFYGNYDLLNKIKQIFPFENLFSQTCYLTCLAHLTYVLDWMLVV